MDDVPKISQRSIIAFCDCSGNPVNQPPVWVKLTNYRSRLTVASLTSVTLKVDGGDEAVLSSGTKDASVSLSGLVVKVSGNAVDAYAYYFNTQYPYQPFGYSDRGSFTLTATTAGDPARGITGCTRDFEINVLLLGEDWPWFDTELRDACLFFRVGEKLVDYPLVPNKSAKWWTDIHADTGFGIQGDGGNQAVVSYTKVGGDFAESGLTLRNDGFTPGGQPQIYLYGTCRRPGIYRVQLDPMRSEIAIPGEGQQALAPFRKGDGETVVCICIYEPYQQGNVVVTLPAATNSPAADAFRCTHSPDFGIPTGYDWGLVNAPFVRYKTQTYEHWSAVVPEYDSAGTTIIHYWYYRAVVTGRVWGLYGYLIERQQGDPPTGYVDPATYAAKTRAEIEARARWSSGLAVADVRNFDDEQPPKQGWRSFEDDIPGAQGRVASVSPSAEGTYSGKPASGTGSGEGTDLLLMYFRYVPVEVDGAVDHYEVYVFIFGIVYALATLDAATMDELKELPGLIEWRQLDDVTELPGGGV